MKTLRLLISILLACTVLLLPGCTDRVEHPSEDGLHIVATTYPLYVLACAVSSGAENVTVGRLSTGQVSCLHDYTLTVSDMRQLEMADLLLLNGAGLEDFMQQALEQLSATQIDCSEPISLLEADGHTHHHEQEDGHDHGHSHEHDPHYWMDPNNLCLITDTIAAALTSADPAHRELYSQNAETVFGGLQTAFSRWQQSLSGVSCPYLITFHDGFHYFAEAFDLHLLFSVEEEDGATASAKDILTASTYVKEYSISVIFMEVNGSGTAARAVSGETGAAISSLSMLMDGEDIPIGSSAEEALSALLTPMAQNIQTLSEVLK